MLGRMGMSSGRYLRTLPRQPQPKLAVSLQALDNPKATKRWSATMKEERVPASIPHETDREQLFRKLALTTFSKEELRRAHAIFSSEASLKDENLIAIAKKVQLVDAAEEESVSVPKRDEFGKRLRNIGEQLDHRVWPVAISFGATGLSIGIIIPILPLLVKEIHLPPSVFGVAVSAFGLAKLLGNPPSAAWVEKYGRKPVMVGGMGVCAVGLGAIGFSLQPELGAPWLIACRFVTGFGVAAFTSGAFMYMSDISTALNRTRTMAPVMSTFQAGTAIGPAIGGISVQQLGITNSYVAVGSTIAFLAIMNSIFLKESRNTLTAAAISTPNKIAEGGNSASPQTKASPTAATESSDSSFGLAYVEWQRLLKHAAIRHVVTLNGFYWIALAGTQLTLLPLFMVAEPLSLSPAQIGSSFAAISIVSVLASQPTAYLADTYGKVPSLLAGVGLLSLSMVAIPLTSSFEQLLVALIPLALGSTLLSTVPTAHLSDLTSQQDRAQALALLRTAGDVGLLLGAITSGAVSEYIGMVTTMETNAALLAGAMVWFARKKYWR